MKNREKFVEKRVYYVKEKVVNEENRYHAGSKARLDMNTVFEENQLQSIKAAFPQEDKRKKANIFKKVFYHLTVYRIWKLALQKVSDGGIVIFQFPVIGHSLFLAHQFKSLYRRNITSILFIHDLEFLRQIVLRKNILSKYRIYKEEVSMIKNASKIVVHNVRMKEELIKQFGISANRIVVLEIFDYLFTDNYAKRNLTSNDENCIIAGNLEKDKAGYVYHLPENVSFNLYGANYEGQKVKNVNYYGVFMPSELPMVMQGAFGVVWDGNSAEICEGVFGEYLRYNNPHKASLYLASGIPVIIWSQAAMANFVLEYGVGFTVNSLSEIRTKIDNLTDEEYRRMKDNAEELSEKLRAGYYTRKALETCLQELSDGV